MLNVLFDENRMAMGGRLFEVKFQLFECMEQLCPGSDYICTGAIPKYLHYVTRLASLVLLLRHAASCSE